MQDQKDTPAIAQQVAILNESAAELVRRGQTEEAIKVYERISSIAPYHIGALDFLAMSAHGRGESDLSLQLLERSLQANPKRALTYMNLGVVHRTRGDDQKSLQAYERALELQPIFPHALLRKATLLETLGRDQEATQAYFKAFKQAPELRDPAQLAKMPPHLQALASHADAFIVQTTQRLLDAAMAPLRAEYADKELQRVDEFLALYTGRQQPKYRHALQRPAFLYFPGLEPRAFFERSEFDWSAGLEAATADIRAELLGILKTPDGLKPYVELDVPDAAQWTELNRSLQWSSFHLYKAGARVEENCQRCPATLKAIEKLPLTRTSGHSPEVFFSILKPGAQIPPHYGLANYKLAVHLPLVVPGDCAIRVGNETRGWEESQCLVFDDSFRHEAWNKSGEVRAVLILDVWNPQLTSAERACVTTLLGVIQHLERDYGSAG